MNLVRSRTYAGNDKSYTYERDITDAVPVDTGSKPLLTKFSTFNLRRYTPEQRKALVEQIRYELSLPPAELNTYIAERYSTEDILAIRDLLREPVRPGSKGQKRRISNRARRRVVDPDEMARRVAKAKATRERNKNDPNYVSYATLKADFKRVQKTVAKKAEAHLRAAGEYYFESEINRTVYRRTAKLERENQKLKEYLRQNNIPLPGTKAAKSRRAWIRAED